MNTQQNKVGFGAGMGQQYDNFEASRDTNEDDEDFDYSKGEAPQTEGQASSLGLNAKKLDESENTNSNYLGDDDGMIHENSQG